MKKLLLTMLILSLLIATLAPIGVGAFADEVEATLAERSFTPNGRNYTLESIPQQRGDYTKSKAPVGVRLEKMYFGSSGIPVVVDLYTDSNSFGDLGFWIGDTANLNDKQLATRNKLVEFFDWVDATINAIDAVANTQYNGEGNLPHSDINKFNQATQGTKLPIDYHTYMMLTIGREMYELTNHAFNPAIYRLVDLWGFSSRVYSHFYFGLPYDRPVTVEEFFGDTGYPLPDPKYVTAFSNPSFTDFSQSAVTLTEENGNYFVTKNVAPVVVDGVSYEQWLDLGGVAKGYVVDLIKQELARLGHTRYCVDAGRSSQSYGYARDGANWQMLHINAFDEWESIIGNPLVAFEVPNRAVSTSGQYVRRYTTNGVEYAHIIDGMRGAPAQTGIKSIAITIPDDDGSNYWACKADCLSTAMTVLGRDGIVDFCNSNFFAQNDI
ncbi:MAG: FAD:protein FMN transferase, partial [Clostridia bacterium]|nr:FAD:protein FMN transferase [Clostridia bacterium]